MTELEKLEKENDELLDKIIKQLDDILEVVYEIKEIREGGNE